MPFTLYNEARNRTVAECVRCSWGVTFRCENGHSGAFGAIELGEKFAAGVTLEQIAERLVCRQCRSREGSLTIRQDVAVAQARDIERFEGDPRPAGFIRPEG